MTPCSIEDRIEYLYRAGDVVRLHTIATTNPARHTVASHVYGSCIIAMELCHLSRIDPGPVLEALLYHDAPEASTGDIPAPVKRAMPVTLREHIDALEMQVCTEYGIPLIGIDPLRAKIVRAADALDLIYTCLRERRLGNRTPQLYSVFSRARGYLEDLLHLPGVAELRYYADKEWNHEY